jgi:prepilin-type N-terminal cleavage/methylation domain-containing protein
MRMSLAGRTIDRSRAGVTLIELMIVVAIVGMIAGITYPAVSSGLESIRLYTASDQIAAFLNAALNRVERRQEVIEMTIWPKENSIVLHSTEAGFERKLELPDGVTIEAVLPVLAEDDRKSARQFILIPGGTAPRMAVEIRNRKGARRIVRVDPMTGVPRIEIPVEAQ